MDKAIATKLEALRKATNAVTEHTVAEEEFADVLGTVRHNEVKLATFRQGTLKEAPPTQVGDKYEIVTTYSKGYSFNLQRIMLDLGRVGLGLKALIEADAVELKWKPSKLTRLLRAHNIDIEVEPRELGPDDMTTDGPHIGRWNKPGYTRVTGKREESNE